MMLKPNSFPETGLFSVDLMTGEGLIAERKRSGWRIFRLPPSISSKSEFFKGACQELPLDPPLRSNQSWDALADSLWSGLNGCPERKILIVWSEASMMEAEAPEDFAIAMDILQELPELLANTDITAGGTKDLIVLKVIDSAK